MMYLREAAEELGLRNVLERVLDYEQVQGVVLTVDRLWLAMKLRSADDRYFRMLRDFYRHGFPPYPLPALPFELEENDRNWTLDADFFRQPPPYWEEFSRYFGNDWKKPPIIVKVCVLPGENIERFQNIESNLPIIVEARPIASLSDSGPPLKRPLEGGLSIGDSSGSVGTLGGMLTGNDGKRYGVTCQHVLKQKGKVYQPALPDGGAAPHIGEVVWDLAAPLTDRKACNPYNSATRGQKIEALDVALVDIEDSITGTNALGIQAVAPASSLYPGLMIDLIGRTSGHRTLSVGALAVTYRFMNESGGYHCMHDLFEVRWPQFARTVLSRPISGGDSGSWVVAQGSKGPEWCGMVVGGDRVRGYATFAEHILNTTSAAGYSLRV